MAVRSAAGISAAAGYQEPSSSEAVSDLACAEAGCSVAASMRHLICSFLIVACALMTQAATPSDSSVNELMRSMQLETLLNQALKQMDEGMAKGMEQGLQKSIQGKELSEAQKAAVEKFHAKFDQTVKEELSYAKVKDIYLQSYKETFTQEEVDAITAFYKSSAGKAVTEKYPAAMQKANALMQSRISPLTVKLQSMLDDFVRQLATTK